MTKLAENIISKALASIDSTSITTEQLTQAVEAITAFNDGAMVFINNCELIQSMKPHYNSIVLRQSYQSIVLLP